MSRARVRVDAGGVCRFCGCSDFDACPEQWLPQACSWVNPERTICTTCAPAARAEAQALAMATTLVTPASTIAAFHRGFIVGWFAVGPETVHGRNPFPVRAAGAPPRAVAWMHGQRAGTAARAAWMAVAGPIRNTPRFGALPGFTTGRVQRRPGRRSPRRRAPLGAPRPAARVEHA